MEKRRRSIFRTSSLVSDIKSSFSHVSYPLVPAHSRSFASISETRARFFRTQHGMMYQMGTITERKRKDGTTAHYAQILIKRKGRIVHREAQTFDRRQAAKAWLARRETELAQPGALERGPDLSCTRPSTGMLLRRKRDRPYQGPGAPYHQKVRHRRVELQRDTEPSHRILCPEILNHNAQGARAYRRRLIIRNAEQRLRCRRGLS